MDDQALLISADDLPESYERGRCCLCQATLGVRLIRAGAVLCLTCRERESYTLDERQAISRARVARLMGAEGKR
jgi:hypothetical protein